VTTLRSIGDLGTKSPPPLRNRTELKRARGISTAVRAVLHILIAAVPRPDVHAKSFIPFARMLTSGGQSLQPFDLVRLFVNIDVPPPMTAALGRTVAGLDALRGIVGLEVVASVNRGVTSFALAMRSLFTECGRRLDRQEDANTFLWLEDDWAIREGRFRAELLPALGPFAFASPSESPSDPTHLLFVSEKPSGTPHCFKQPSFDAIVAFLDGLPPGTALDPDLLYYQTSATLRRRGLLRPQQVALSKTSIDPDGLFYDLGRAWRRAHGIRKVKKGKDKGNGTWVFSIS
jgi:hypothetical protein